MGLDIAKKGLPKKESRIPLALLTALMYKNGGRHGFDQSG
jgi:hypothetical protein